MILVVYQLLILCKLNIQMDKTRRKKEALESEKTSREDNESFEENEDITTHRLRRLQQCVFSYRGGSQDQRKFEEDHEDPHKEKKKLTSHDEEDRYNDFREQQHEGTYDNSKVLNKQTANKI